ncbi:MAG: hypothetical protein ACR2MB_12320 [Acidimicrobiales bacterium]
MVKLPATFATADLRRLGGLDGRQRVRCPIFTEAGKSRLALDFVVGWDGYGNPSVFPERVVDTATGLVLLTEVDAPARLAPRDERLPGTGEDPRIRRDAQIGDANLVDQICGRIEQAHGADIDMSQLNRPAGGLRARAGHGEAHEHQLYTFVEDHPEWIRELIWAARHIGADAHADYLDHALDVVATFRWDEPGRESLDIDYVEDGTDIIDAGQLHPSEPRRVLPLTFMCLCCCI